jgi:hypothetical protein
MLRNFAWQNRPLYADFEGRGMAKFRRERRIWRSLNEKRGPFFSPLGQVSKRANIWGKNKKKKNLEERIRRVK